jgi:biopolymer transport protein ExbD
MAAMLDMAFQLLAFFIATFKPMTLEQQIALKLPPPERVQNNQPSTPNKNNDVLTLLQSLRIGVEATPDGTLGGLTFLDNGSKARDLNDLQAKAQAILDRKDSPVEQVILEIDPRLDLQHTMEVLDRCRSLKMPDGKQLTKISPILARVGGGPQK